jgi:hypothetical protein
MIRYRLQFLLAATAGVIVPLLVCIGAANVVRVCRGGTVDSPSDFIFSEPLEEPASSVRASAPTKEDWNSRLPPMGILVWHKPWWGGTLIPLALIALELTGIWLVLATALFPPWKPSRWTTWGLRATTFISAIGGFTISIPWMCAVYLDLCVPLPGFW